LLDGRLCRGCDVFMSSPPGACRDDIAHRVRQEGLRYRLGRLPADYWITFQF